VILSGEDVAGGPGKLCAEGLEGLDKNGRLDGWGGLAGNSERWAGQTYSCAGIRQYGHPSMAAPRRTSGELP
jgi:hypothetical protein